MPPRDAQRAQANLVCSRTRGPHRGWDRLSWSISCGGTGQLWPAAGAGLWMQRTWVWLKPSWRGHHQSHHRAARTYTGLRKRLLEGTNRTLYTRMQEKGAVTPQETGPDLPLSAQESPAGRGSAVACCGVGDIGCSSLWMGAFEGGHHHLHYLHHNLNPGNNREGTQPHPSTENWIKDLLSMAPPIRTSLFPPQSVSQIRKR